MPDYKEYKNFDPISIEKEVRKFWDDDHTFEKSLSTREGNKEYVFYEGPPSANGMPGIHHVISRTIKDIFCRYKTLKGYLVHRKAGWDTHGLPVEISVEKSLGITKEDIGKSISVIEFNQACRKDVLKFKNHWDELTQIMGYWLDLDDPYITFDNKYIETLWWLLKQLFDKGLLYQGYSIQPYSPAAGTGLSTHELNQPGCYKMVKDTTCVAQFKVIKDEKSEFLFKITDTDLFFLAWTTTPWTLPSNTALALGKNITYVVVKTFNQYTHLPVTLILAKDLFDNYFPGKNADLKLEDYKTGDKEIPFQIVSEFKGSKFEFIRYEQLLPYVQPETGKSFIAVTADFVSTEDGTGIVHIAPSFGSDDFKVAADYGLGHLTLVNKQGKFIETMGEFAGRYVKSEYDQNFDPKTDNSVDVDIVVKLKKENKAFKTEKYEHSYPHCWRTDKPILYYPLESWFVKTTAMKDRMVELNRTINWKPASTGLGRFENWLENVVDWNLSRSRFWGTPLPIWVSADRSEMKCIGSLEELKAEIEKSIQAGFMKSSHFKDFTPGDFSVDNYNKIDLHRPYVDEIVLVSASGKPMNRESDLIDVWFDSGAMPYAQFHYPFENKDLTKYFPADLIAEGVDQTRGWFYTLHAISSLVFDSVSYKNVISNGLVLDKKGNKMSKRLGNAADPFEIMSQNGADTLRWYMMTNAQPWDNLKFDVEGLNEVKRKFFGTLFNTYSFFSLYANIDKFTYSEPEIPINERPELDRSILSQLNSLIKEVDESYDNYEPTKAGRAIQDFVIDHLSNWYVRLSRRRFWKGDYTNDKISAYQTLYTCLDVVSRLMSVISPFYSDRLFQDLNSVTKKSKWESVHLTNFPVCDETLIDKDLEQRMDIAQKISSMVLSLRKKENIRVRQPLSRIMVPVLDKKFKSQVQAVSELILSETNTKKIEFLTDTDSIIVKRIKPDFKKLGPLFGAMMKDVASQLTQLNQQQIKQFEKDEKYSMNLNGQNADILLSDVEIYSEDIPGWQVAHMGKYTVALDINITHELKNEGLARELVNRIQNIRKNMDFDVTDHIQIEIQKESSLEEAINQFKSYICSETLADELTLSETLESNKELIEIEDVKTYIIIKSN
jgi:isoleucyl-tRNA synthetase